MVSKVDRGKEQDRTNPGGLQVGGVGEAVYVGGVPPEACPVLTTLVRSSTGE